MDVSELRALGAHVAARQDELLEAESPDPKLRAALAARTLGRGAARPHRALRPLLAGTVGVVCGLGASAIFFGAELLRDRPAPLSFTLDEPARPGAIGEWASAPAERELPIRFSDGSSLSLKPDARARVVRVAENGAELVIESGHADVHVVHRDHSDWQIRSGPFVVQVTGTRFRVGWEPRTDELALEVYEGSVLVSGCAFERGNPVHAGEKLKASCARDHTSSRPIAPIEQSAASASAATGDAPVVGKSLPRQPSWQELARQGQYARAYELARAAGFEAECRKRSAADVLELADAARLAGRASDAELAYTIVRSRFRSSDAGAQAAFALGRGAFQAGQMTAAAQWFRTYLAERPSGALAQVALGRLLEAYVRLGDESSARATAERYIAQYPAGPHAHEARKVLSIESPSIQP